MGSYNRCLMNKPDGGTGYGQCYVCCITPTAIQRSALLQEKQRLDILPSFDDCNGPECTYTTKRKSDIRVEAWRKRLELYKIIN